MERLQKRAGRAILKVPVRTPSYLVRNKLGWNELVDRRHKNLRVAVFKCLAGLVPVGLKDTFTLVRDSHGHNTRVVFMVTFLSISNQILKPVNVPSCSGEH